MKDSDVRIMLNLPAEIAVKVDDYWHTARLMSRQAAIRDLLAYALDRKFGDIQPTEKQPGA
jgi:hypothetical protein